MPEYPVDLTVDGLEPPFGFLKPDSPSGGLHFSSAMLPNGLEPIARIGLAYPVYETGVLPLN